MYIFHHYWISFEILRSSLRTYKVQMFYTAIEWFYSIRLTYSTVQWYDLICLVCELVFKYLSVKKFAFTPIYLAWEGLKTRISRRTGTQRNDQNWFWCIDDRNFISPVFSYFVKKKMLKSATGKNKFKIVVLIYGIAVLHF